MSEKKIRYCDGCGKEWTQVNHWLAAIISATDPTFTTCEAANSSSILAAGGLRYDFCGHACATEAFSRWLGTGTLAKPEAPGKDSTA